ncbi:MAG: small ribosomal subunit Rsm22 family protein [Treponema sp.]|nr:small ribosomal subunit Rsm22 family protein [Treponema sp.]
MREAALVTALNLYNELSQPISPGNDAGQRRFADKQAALLSGFAAGGGRLLVVEPGTPPSGRFITLLREALIGQGRPPLAPCTHSLPCPFPALRPPAAGRDTKWCHFAFDTEDAPAGLHRLSAAAGIPKERATLSFLLAGPQGPGQPKHGGPQSPAEQKARIVRVISSPFPARADGQAWGRYACGEQGMVLLRGAKTAVEAAEPGTLLAVRSTGERDPKSGAPVVTAP